MSDHSVRKTLATVVQREQQKACERMPEKQSEGDLKLTSNIAKALVTILAINQLFLRFFVHVNWKPFSR